MFYIQLLLSLLCAVIKSSSETTYIDNQAGRGTLKVLLADPNYQSFFWFVKTLTDETLNIISIKKDLSSLRDRLRNQEAEFTRELTIWQRRTEAATDQLRSKFSDLCEARV